jgi:hypothetical protein
MELDILIRELTVPVVSEFDLILHPFSLLETVESENVMPETTLLLFPPTDPILKPLKKFLLVIAKTIWAYSTYWPPEQVMPVTVTLVPLVTATQSSWFITIVFERTTLLLEEKSNPSLLWAAGSPSLAELAASPAVLLSVSPVIVNPSQLVTSKQWVGQFWM